MSIEINEKPERLCEDLLGLYFTNLDETLERYVHAFSFSKDILENMIANDVEEEEKKYYSIHPIKLYRLFEQSSLPDDRKYSLMYRKKQAYSDIKYPIYGYNFMYINTTSNSCDLLCNQVFVIYTYNMRTFEKNGISSIPIEIDTFYYESILNA